MVDTTNSNRMRQIPAYQALTGVFALGFKFLAWINGLGVLVVILCALGLTQNDFSPAILRLPLTAFTVGLAFCGLALLWSYLVHASLFTQLITGQARRTHWVPLFCALVAYTLSLVAFVMGCWLVLGASSLVSHDAAFTSSSDERGVAPQDQSGQALEIYTPQRLGVIFLKRQG